MLVLGVTVAHLLSLPRSRTDAFLWRLPSTPGIFPMEATPTDQALNHKTFADVIGSSREDEDDGVGRYKYLGDLPDLQSSEVTVLSVRAPLLATGLANGRIFLWRCRCVVDGDIPLCSAMIVHQALHGRVRRKGVYQSTRQRQTYNQNYNGMRTLHNCTCLQAVGY